MSSTEIRWSNPTTAAWHVCHKNTAIYSLKHGLNTLTAVPRLSQLSTLCGMGKWVCNWTE